MAECPHCKAQNLESKPFCGDCGGPLDHGLVRESLREQVQNIIREHYKDQRIVDVETTQAIASRLVDWAKLFGFFIGIPIATLLLIVGALGIKTYSDFKAQVGKAQESIVSDFTAKVDATQKDILARAAKLKADGEALAADYEKLRAQFADTKALAERVDTLSHQVDVIGEKLGFTPSSKISVERKRRLAENFANFQRYLTNLGYRGTAETITLDIRDKMETGALAFYDPDKRMMVIDNKYADDPLILYREYGHHVLYSASGVPDDAEMTLSFYYALESGLAWYFPCSFVNDPKPSTTAASWDLTKKRRFSDLRPDVSSAIVDGTEIWGSAFWELRQLLGQNTADKLLFATWFKLRPNEMRSDRGASFVKKLIDAGGSNQEKQIRAIFTQRGLAF